MRITQKDLEQKATLLNEITGSPLTGWTRTDGKNIANIGHYYISCAYGGVNLNRHVNLGGGANEPLSFGHVPKKELYQMLCAFIAGIESIGV